MIPLSVLDLSPVPEGSIEPYTSGRIHLVESERPSYRVIDQNILAGHPVIVQFKLPDGGMHFVVVAARTGGITSCAIPLPTLAARFIRSRTFPRRLTISTSF